jgi:hypothetical protein
MTLKVPKKKVFLAATFVGGGSIRGNVFLSTQSRLHYGDEQVIDLLHSTEQFFPFSLEDSDSVRIVNKHSITALFTFEEAGPDDELGKRAKVTVKMTDGRELTGEVIIDEPQYKSRILDFLNADQRLFFRLLGDGGTYYLNTHHVSQVIPG